MSDCVIYGLVDPRTGAVRYVGKSVDADIRLREHVARVQRCRGRSRSLSPVQWWLTRLLDVGMAPEVTVLATCDEDTWEAEERAWIARIQAEGGDLCNVQEGGVQSRRWRADAPRATRQTPSVSSWVNAHPRMLPEELIAARLALGLSQRQLANVLGFNPSAMSLYESGKRRIPHRVRLAVERITPAGS